MLVVSRKRGEQILIGDGIELQVISIRGKQVRLGLNCPRDVRILRAELLHTADKMKTNPLTMPADSLQKTAG